MEMHEAHYSKPVFFLSEQRRWNNTGNSCIGLCCRYGCLQVNSGGIIAHSLHIICLRHMTYQIFFC